MAVTIRVPNDLNPFIGKSVARVSMSAYDIGVHFLQDSAFLVEGTWSLKDVQQQEVDRSFGLKLRQTACSLFLTGQKLNKVDLKSGCMELVFDKHTLQLPLAEDQPRLTDGITSRWAVLWDPLALTTPGSLLGKKDKKKMLVHRVNVLAKDIARLTAICGQSVSRVFWSKDEVGIYFYGHELLMIEKSWVLLDSKGTAIDRAQPFMQRQGTALFRLIGLALNAVDRTGSVLKFNFEGGMVLSLG